MKARTNGDYIQVNRQPWNAKAIRNEPEKAKMVEQIRDGYAYLEKMEKKIAPYMRDIRGKKIIVPQFGDALVLLACAKRGAIVTGVDLSDEQIRLARKAAAYCGVNVTLIEADCQKPPKNILKNCFDLAVAECGIFIWIGNVDAWMRNVYRVLKSGGKLIVSDFHPLSIISEEKEGKVTFKRSYFDQRPEVCQSEETLPAAIEFHWKLSDIINAAIEARFRIDCVEEYYAEYKRRIVPLLPTDFLLVATKA